MMFKCLAVTLMAALVACGAKEEQRAAAQVSAIETIGPAECAACGMVVREQPSPRAQVVHRDGTRVFLCSVDELTQYVRAPSPHGAVVGKWVETVDPGLNPAETPTDQRPWIDASTASYVVGIDRPRIMGPPALVFETREVADKVAGKHGAAVRSWEAVRAGMDRDVHRHRRTKSHPTGAGQ